MLRGLRFEHAIRLGVDARAAGRAIALAAPAHFDARIVDDLADHVEKRRLIFIRMQAHVDRRLRFRRESRCSGSRRSTIVGTSEVCTIDQ